MIVLHFRRGILKAALLSISLVAILFFGFSASPYIQSVASAGQKPVYAVDREEKVIALSFDASWGAEHTEELLATLEQYHVKTTFFLVNLWIEEYPELVKAIDEAGHEIGLHSATHPHFTELSTEEMIAELNQNKEALKKIIGKEATIFRPPYGDYNDAVIETVSSQGLTAVQWSVDSLDWKGLEAEEISGRVLSGAAPGAIVLLHNNGDHTAEALGSILPSLLNSGYKIVPVGEILFPGDSYTDANGIMHGKDDES